MVRALSEIHPGDGQVFGRKAEGLGELRRAGFSVPDGFCVSGRAFAQHAQAVLGLGWADVGHQAQVDSDQGLQRLAAIRHQIETTEVATVVAAQIAEAYGNLGSDSPVVAVRSSSTLEDGDFASAAGIQDTRLGVVGAPAVMAAVRSVWASLWTVRAQSYLRSTRSRPEVLIAVLVQRLIRPDVAGVMFTANPVTGSRDEVLINCAYGLGEPVLSGRVSPDTYVVEKCSQSVTARTVSDKQFMVTVSDQGVRTVELGPSAARSACLDDRQARDLAHIGQKVERHVGGPMDIEWAMADGSTYLLQARPVTTCPASSGGDGGSVQPSSANDVWTNANVGEALPGVATPLTWSIAERYSDQGFRRAFAALGCRVPDGTVLVGKFHGRIYLNLTRFLQVASQVPVLSAAALAELGGIDGIDALQQSTPRGFDWGSTGPFLARLPMAMARLVRQNLAVERSVQALEARVGDHARRLERLTFDDLSQQSLDAQLSRVDSLLEASGDAMLTCAANALGSFLVVRYLFAKWLGTEGTSLVKKLLAGVSDLESAKPGSALWHMAEAIRMDPAVSRPLLQSDLAELSIDSFQGTRLGRDLEAFMAAYGFRAVREAELMTPRWSEDPTLIFATLREYVRSGGPPPERAVEERLQSHARAWQRVDARLGPVRRTLARRLVQTARRYGRLRERLRARVTQVLGLYRQIALEAGRRLGDTNAAFFFTIDELHRYLDGSLTTFGSLLSARRAQYVIETRLPDPPSTFVGRPPEVYAPPSHDHGELCGVAASPGLATGKATVLTRPDQAGQLRAGDVLVVSCADVGWSPLFLLAGAVVTELGGVLSHAAVVAREYGVPAVFNVRSATTRIRSGQTVTVDGSAGTILIHDLA